MGTLTSKTRDFDHEIREIVDEAVRESMPSSLDRACNGISEESLKMYRLSKSTLDSLTDLMNEYAIVIERMDNRLREIEIKIGDVEGHVKWMKQDREKERSKKD